MQVLRRSTRGLVAALVILLILAALGYAAIQRMPWYEAMPEAIAALEEPLPGVDIYQDEAGWWVFMPDGSDPKGLMLIVGGELSEYGGGMIFYPGARVDPRAYAPLARAVAEMGYPAVIVPMPFGLPVFGAGRASKVMEAFPKVPYWVMAGHSLGGVMAAQHAASRPEGVAGLFLLAAWAPNAALAGRDLPVYSLDASEDRLATPQEVAEHADRLPEGAIRHTIQGGNHAQFGWYGEQAGDGLATIARDEQQAQVARSAIGFMPEAIMAARSRSGR